MSSTQEVGEIFGAGRGPAHAMLRSPTVLIVAVGLWGLNIMFFRLFGIDYVKVLQHDLQKIDGNSENNNNTNSNGKCSSASTPTSEPKPMNSTSSTTTTTTLLKLPLQMQTSTANGSSDDSNVVRQRSNKPEDSSAQQLGAYDSDEDPFEEDDEEIAEMYPLKGGGGPVEADQNAITWTRLVMLSLGLLVLLHATYFYWIDVLQGGSISAVFIFYATVIVAIIVPFDQTMWLRRATRITLWRVGELIRPRCANAEPRPIPFVDVFVADAMCSLSKVFFDWGMLIHMATHYPHPVPKDYHMIVFPSLAAAIPFIIRARQCLIMYNIGRIARDKSRYAHIANAIKYSTSIWPLCVSVYQKLLPTSGQQAVEPILITLVIINSCYALYWDIVMDWGFFASPTLAVSAACAATAPMISQSAPGGPNKLEPPGTTNGNTSPSCHHAVLRPRLRFGEGVSMLVLGADTILRFSWTLRFFPKLFSSNDSFVLATQFLEIFRRALWNLLRVEWEQLKHQKAAAAAATNSRRRRPLELAKKGDAPAPVVQAMKHV